MYFLRIENDGKFHELLKIDEYGDCCCYYYWYMLISVFHQLNRLYYKMMTMLWRKKSSSSSSRICTSIKATHIYSIVCLVLSYLNNLIYEEERKLQSSFQPSKGKEPKKKKTINKFKEKKENSNH